jgi:hypothetical protein
VSIVLCKICAQPTQPRARATIIGRHEVQYFQCPACGFVQTEDPYWLGEAYADAISDIDLGVINRSITFGQLTRNLILSSFDCNARFLDYGGGPGVFVRMMRDRGLDFFLYDKYCQNMFARGFEADLSVPDRFELITAFEVFEHFVAPLDEIEYLLRYSESILFSTLLLPAHNPGPGEWWYYALEHGQHVSIYTYKALAIIAKRIDLHLHSNGTSLHLLTKKQLAPRAFQLIFHKKISAVLNVFYAKRQKRASLLEEDFYKGSGLRMTQHNRS